MMCRRPKFQTPLLAAAALVLMLSACGDSSAEAVDAGDADVTTETEEAADTSEEAADEGDAGDDDADADADADAADASDTSDEVFFEISTLPAGPASFRMLGGIELELPEPTTVIHADTCVIIEVADQDTSSPFPAAIVLANPQFSGHNAHTPVSTIDEWLALYEGQPAPTPTGETMEFLGEELAHYAVDGAYIDGPPPMDNFLNCSAQEEEMAGASFLPSGTASTWIAEVDSGLLVVNAGAFTEEELVTSQALLAAVLPTVVLAGS